MRAKEFDRYEPVEMLAKVLKTKILTYTKRRELEGELAKLTLQALHLEAFVGEDTVDNILMEDLPGYKKMSNLVFTEAFNYALKTYGKTDVATGEVIPFMKLVNYVMLLKKNQIVQEKINEKDYINRAIMGNKMRELIGDIKRRNRVGLKVTNCNVLNINKVRALLKEIGGTFEDLDLAESILAQNYVCADIINKEEWTKLTAIASDRQAFKNANIVERSALQIVTFVENALCSARSLTVKKHIIYYLTLKAQDYDLHPLTRLYLRQYIDMDLVKYMKANKCQYDDVTLLAKYLRMERETVRKNLRKAQLTFINARDAKAS